MIKKNYTSPVLEVIEIGFGALQCGSPLAVPSSPAGISKYEDWATDNNNENDYDI